MSDSDQSAAEANFALLDRFLAAIESGDADTVLAVYSDDARIWHNFDQLVVSPQDNARQVKWFSSRLANMKYTEIRRIAFPGGVVQQHVLRGIAPNGEPVAVFAMLRIDITDGRIVALDEYLDPAQAAALSEPRPRAD